MTLIQLDRNNLREQAGDLNALGALWFLWEFEREHQPTDTQDWVRGRVVGFAVDADENPCLLIRTANPNDGGRFVTRCIPADRIVGVRTTKEGLNASQEEEPMR